VKNGNVMELQIVDLTASSLALQINILLEPTCKNAFITSFEVHKSISLNTALC